MEIFQNIPNLYEYVYYKIYNEEELLNRFKFSINTIVINTVFDIEFLHILNVHKN